MQGAQRDRKAVGDSFSVCLEASGGIDLSGFWVSDTLTLGLLPHFGQFVLESSVAAPAPDVGSTTSPPFPSHFPRPPLPSHWSKPPAFPLRSSEQPPNWAAFFLCPLEFILHVADSESIETQVKSYHSSAQNPSHSESK